MSNASNLTISHVQRHQPWTVPYSESFHRARQSAPHIIGTHVALHVMKTAGKIASVFESLDHGPGKDVSPAMQPHQLEMIANMSADLLTAALRFANLYEFDLAAKLAERVQETNGVTWPDMYAGSDAKTVSGICSSAADALRELHPGIDL